MIDGQTRHILDTFIHFMKGGMSFDDVFEDWTKNTKKWCPFNQGEFIDNECYKNNLAVEILLAYLEKYILRNRFLDSNKYYVDEMDKILNELKNPQLLETYDRFEELLSDTRELISALEPGIRKKLTGLTCEECERLDEALVTYSNYCFYSSIIMAVSAVEFRLHLYD